MQQSAILKSQGPPKVRLMKLSCYDWLALCRFDRFSHAPLSPFLCHQSRCLLRLAPFWRYLVSQNCSNRSWVVEHTWILVSGSSHSTHCRRHFGCRAWLGDAPRRFIPRFFVFCLLLAVVPLDIAFDRCFTHRFCLFCVSHCASSSCCLHVVVLFVCCCVSSFFFVLTFIIMFNCRVLLVVVSYRFFLLCKSEGSPVDRQSA